MDDHQTTPAMIRRIQDLVRDRYVLEHDAERIAGSLNDAALLRTDRPAEEVAQALTRQLQQVNNDRHLRVRYRPEGAASGFGSADYEARYAADAARNAGGIRQVRLLDSGSGLLQITPALSPVHLAEPYVHAAFTLLSAVRALVIDLREGGGGTPETVALICGHLLDNEPVHLQDIVERDGPPRQYWTSPAATRIGGAVRVLISNRTFSGCEELAYNLQALRRAVVIGETSRGGAHPVEAFKLSAVLELHLPIARSINAVTHTNWEQTGVTPDIPCPATDALDVAERDLMARPAQEGLDE